MNNIGRSKKIVEILQAMQAEVKELTTAYESDLNKVIAPAFDTERKLSWLLQVWYPKQEKPFDLVNAEQMMHDLLERISNTRGGLRERLRELGFTGNF